MMKGLATMQCMRFAPSMTKDCLRKMREMYKHYYPIETDLTVTKEDKFRHMYEWTRQNMVDFSELNMNSREFHFII